MEKTRMPYLLFWPETNLDSIVKHLQSMKNDKYNYYFDFLGHTLESDTVTLEDAYLEVYGMSREEYREKLKESYQKYQQILEETAKARREKKEKEKQKIHDMAKGVIPEDKMPIYEEAYRIIQDKYFTIYETQLEFIDFIKYLDSDDFKLQEALATYKKFMTMDIFSNYDLLRCLKELTVHGVELYNALVDEEEVQRLKANIRRYQLAQNLDIFPLNYKFPEPTEEDLLTSFDIRRTTNAFFAYSLLPKKDSEGKGLK